MELISIGKFAKHVGVNVVMLATKIRLKPTKEQEVLFWKSAGTARWAYNYFLAENERIFNDEKRIVTEGRSS